MHRKDLLANLTGLIQRVKKGWSRLSKCFRLPERLWKSNQAINLLKPGLLPSIHQQEWELRHFHIAVVRKPKIIKNKHPSGLCSFDLDINLVIAYLLNRVRSLILKACHTWVASITIRRIDNRNWRIRIECKVDLFFLRSNIDGGEVAHTIEVINFKVKFLVRRFFKIIVVYFLFILFIRWSYFLTKWKIIQMFIFDLLYSLTLRWLWRILSVTRSL